MLCLNPFNSWLFSQVIYLWVSAKQRPQLDGNASNRPVSIVKRARLRAATQWAPGAAHTPHRIPSHMQHVHYLLSVFEPWLEGAVCV